MKKFLFTIVFFLAVFNNAIAGNRLETVIENIPGVYDIQFDNGDMVVTSNNALIKIILTQQSSTDFPMNVLADVPDIALSSVRDGADYYVLRNIDRSLLKVAYSGEVSVVANNLGAPIDIARFGEGFIVSDIGNPANASENTRLLMVSRDGTVSEITNEGFSESAGMAGIEVVGESVWVTDFNLGKLYKIELDGTFVEVANDLGHPVGIEYDGKDFIIADFGNGSEGVPNGRLLRVSKNGRVRNLTPVVSMMGELGNPSDLALLGGDIYFSDIILGRISKINCGLCRKRFPYFHFDY